MRSRRLGVFRVAFAIVEGVAVGVAAKAPIAAMIYFCVIVTAIRLRWKRACRRFGAVGCAALSVRAWRSQRRYDALMADLNQIAHRIVRESTEPRAPESKAQVSGRKGGLKGGQARASKLTAERRSEIARKAAETRWRKA